MFKENLLNNKTALITGGGSGLGKAIARMYHTCGAKVCIAGRDVDRLAKTADEIGSDVMTHQCDVRDPEQVSAMIGAVVSKWQRLDILVNNAAGNFIVPAEELSPGGWKAVIDIVLNGTFYCSHYAGKEMIRQKSGTILNMLATYAWTGNAGTIHSAAAKAGVLALTRTLAVEWGRHGISINALAPGPVDTAGARQNLWAIPQIQDHLKKQIPSGRFGNEDEIAQAAAFLVSEGAGFINGEVLVIDGGMWLNRSMFNLEELPALANALKKKLKPGSS